MAEQITHKKKLAAFFTRTQETFHNTQVVLPFVISTVCGQSWVSRCDHLLLFLAVECKVSKNNATWIKLIDVILMIRIHRTLAIIQIVAVNDREVLRVDGILQLRREGCSVRAKPRPVHTFEKRMCLNVLERHPIFCVAQQSFHERNGGIWDSAIRRKD
eukprot:TRINITY_DN7508_c0_g1_i1.p1 TRINITY_DN7508_c0_g1~~TRINITY_DN7508_c0_g1_i1.p1  ORF type:complete len:159 (+),score=1.14 TRINITY_DN7508_c0_g1_i1:456-932(+)